MAAQFSRYLLTQEEMAWYIKHYGMPGPIVEDIKEDRRETSSWHAAIEELSRKMRYLDTHQFGLEADLPVDDRASIKVELWALDELVTEGPLAFSGRQ